jgi:glycine betaine/choline ABC-type transport system substrate-binding protein
LRGLRRWRHLLTFLGSVVVVGNRGLQLTGNITPLVRRDVIARCGPNLLAVLNSILALLGTGTLRALGARVELAGQDSRLVVGGWLRAHGLSRAGVRRGE